MLEVFMNEMPIFILAIFGIFFGFLIIILFVESLDLIFQKNLFNKFNSIIQEQSKNEGKNQIAKLLQEDQKNGVVFNITKAIWESRTISNPNIEAIMGLLFSREGTYLSAAKIIPNLLMLTGLLGTVYSLASSVGKLQLNNPTSLEIFQSQLSSTVASMQGGFGATLFGVFLSVVASLLLSVFALLRDQFLSQLQTFILVSFIPLVFPSSTEAQLEEQQKLLAQSNETVKEFTTVLTITTATFKSVLTDAGNHVQETLEKLEDVSSNATQMINTVTARVDEFGNLLNQGAENLARAAENGSKRFENAAEDLTKQLSGQIKEIGELQVGFAKKSDDILEQVGGLTGVLDKTVAAFREEGGKQLVRSNEVVGRLDTRFERLENGLPSLFGNATTVLTTHFSSQTDKIAELQTDFSSKSDQISRQLGELAKNLDDTIKAFREEGSNQISKSNDIIRHLDDRFARLEKSLPSLSEKYIETFGVLNETFEVLNVSFRQLEAAISIFQTEQGVGIPSEKEENISNSSGNEKLELLWRKKGDPRPLGKK